MLLCPTPTACLSQASEFARSAGRAVRGKGMTGVPLCWTTHLAQAADGL